LNERKKEKFWQDLNMQLVITYKSLDYLFIYLFGLQTDTCNAKWFFLIKLVKNIYLKKTKNWGYYFGQVKYFDNE
jgi:hypothetical protein